MTWRKVAPYKLPPVLPEKARSGRKSKKHKVGVVPAATRPKIKERVEILWPDDGIWYEATVVNFSPELVQHGLLYSTGETEWVDLQGSASTWRMSQKSHEPPPTEHSLFSCWLSSHLVLVFLSINRVRGAKSAWSTTSSSDPCMPRARA